MRVWGEDGIHLQINLVSSAHAQTIPVSETEDALKHIKALDVPSEA